MSIIGLQGTPRSPHHLLMAREDLAPGGHARQAAYEVVVKAPRLAGEPIKVWRRDRAFPVGRQVMAVETIDVQGSTNLPAKRPLLRQPYLPRAPRLPLT